LSERIGDLGGKAQRRGKELREQRLEGKTGSRRGIENIT